MAAFFGAILGTSVLILRDWIAHRVSQRQRATYLAIRVVNSLDPFVDACAEACRDNGYLGPPRDSEEAEQTTKTPTAPSFPSDLDWQSIDHRIAFDILSFENKVADAEKDTDIAAEFAFAPDYGEYYSTRSRAYTALGLEAARIARVLRDTHHLPRRAFGRWNPEQVLETRKKELDEEDREEREQARKDAASWNL